MHIPILFFYKKTFICILRLEEFFFGLCLNGHILYRLSHLFMFFSFNPVDMFSKFQSTYVIDHTIINHLGDIRLFLQGIGSLGKLDVA